MKSDPLIAAIFGLALLGAQPANLHATIDGLPGANDNPYMDRHVKGSSMDRNALREMVDETQALLDGLAHESRGLDKKSLEPLFVSLKDEYHQGDYVGKTRKALEQAEAVLDVQDAIKAQQARVKATPASDAQASQQEETKLLGMQSDLVTSVDHLRDTLREIHTNANEDVTRDLRNWIMISEGLLRGQREDREAAKALSPTASAQALSPTGTIDSVPAPQGVSPAATVQALSATAQP